MRTFVTCVGHALILSITALSVPAQFKVICIGDSITEGRPAYPGYRHPLWGTLRSAGYCADFSTATNASGKRGVATAPPVNQTQMNPVTPIFDQDHFAWSAETSVSVVSRLVQFPTITPVPDVALVHLGTNDAILDFLANIPPATTASTVEGQLQALISHLHNNVNASMKVLVARIIPFGPQNTPGIDQWIQAINAKVDGLAGIANVHIVDMYNGFNWSTMTFDVLHPNAAGASFMAGRWFGTMQAVLPQPPIDAPCFREYGRGCAGGPGTQATLTTTALPRVGTTVPLSIRGLHANTPAVGWFGYAPQALQMPVGDCYLFVNSTVLLGLGTTNGQGALTWNVSIPAGSPPGIRMYVQATTTSGGNLWVTNGGELEVGL